jgi:hypothetical protein
MTDPQIRAVHRTGEQPEQWQEHEAGSHAASAALHGRVSLGILPLPAASRNAHKKTLSRPSGYIFFILIRLRRWIGIQERD